MTSQVDNNAFEVELTPNKKRKREKYFDKFVPQLSETKGNDNPGLNLNSKSNKENFVCMEVKSISDLSTSENPFEVIRKPPIKKKKFEVQDNCFINPGLNLNVVEKTPFNPFEVKRPEVSSCNSNIEQENHCFVNPCLSISGPEKQTNYNPFEVFRENQEQGIENPGLELPTFAIALPFTPTLGRRINFNQGTPSELLAKTLVFSPENLNGKTPKRNLSVISEELNIDEELDSYQLELENSINEAKTKNNKKKGNGLMMNMKHISEFSKKLSNLQDIEEIEDTVSELDTVQSVENKSESNIKITIKETQIELKIDNNDVLDNSDVVFEEINESNIDDFKPIPFTRTFRRDQKPKIIKNNGKDNDNIPAVTIKDKLRRSFRKFVKNNNNNNEEKKEKTTNNSIGLISTIRQSFRRKKPIVLSSPIHEENITDISIIDDGKRHIFRQPETELFLQRTTFRSSLRKSTKGVRRQMTKTVLKNNDNYKLE